MSMTSEIRVAFVTPSRARGWRCQPIFREFVRLFPETAVFTAFWPGFTGGFQGSFQVRKLHGVHFYPRIRRDEGTAQGFTFVSPRALVDLLRFRPQVIFTNGLHMCAVYALLLKMILGTRVVLLWQGVSAETGGAPGSRRLRLRQAMAQFFDLAICNTREGVQYLQTTVGFPESRVWQQVCEVADRSSLSQASPAPAPKPLAHPAFLFVGRTIRQKGLECLLQASSLLAKRGHHFSLRVVGEGADQPLLRKMAADLGIEDHVCWDGFVSYDQLGPRYEACDVFVLPSLEDTWGVTVLEAMAFSKPVLCSKYAGASDIVQHGLNGFAFDAHDPEQLADYMSRFIQQPELLSRMGAASGEISASYTPQRTAQVLADAVKITMSRRLVPLATSPTNKNCSSLSQ